MRLRRTTLQPDGRSDQRALPANFQVIFGSSITLAVIVMFTLNLVFNHWYWRRPRTEDAVGKALQPNHHPN